MDERRSTGTRQAERPTGRSPRRSATATVVVALWVGVARGAARAVGRWATRSRRRLVGTVVAALLGLWLIAGLIAPTAFISVSVSPDDRHMPSEVVVHNWSPLGIETGPISTSVERFEDGRWQRLPPGPTLAYGVSLPPVIGRWQTGVPGADALEPGRYRLVQEVRFVRREGREVTARFEVARPDGWERGVPPPGPDQGVWWLHG